MLEAGNALPMHILQAPPSACVGVGEESSEPAYPPRSIANNV